MMDEEVYLRCEVAVRHAVNRPMDARYIDELWGCVTAMSAFNHPKVSDWIDCFCRNCYCYKELGKESA